VAAKVSTRSSRYWRKLRKRRIAGAGARTVCDRGQGIRTTAGRTEGDRGQADGLASRHACSRRLAQIPGWTIGATTLVMKTPIRARSPPAGTLRPGSG